MIQQVKQMAKRALQRAGGFVKRNAKALAAGAGVAVSGASAFAQSTPVDDANAIVTSATTTFNNVATLVVAAASFSIIMAFVWRVKSRKG